MSSRRKLGYVYFKDGHKEGISKYYISGVPAEIVEFYTVSGKYMYTKCICRLKNKTRTYYWFGKYEPGRSKKHGIYERCRNANIERLEMYRGKQTILVTKDTVAIMENGKLIYLR